MAQSAVDPVKWLKTNCRAPETLQEESPMTRCDRVEVVEGKESQETTSQLPEGVVEDITYSK